jgi:hypothetical protein
MNALQKKAVKDATRESVLHAAEDDLREDWFAQPASDTRPIARPKSVPPTGDEEVDGWLR